MSEEIWKSLEEYPNHKFSNLWNVFSIKSNMIIKWTNCDWYRAINTWIKYLLVHRVVARLFIDNPYCYNIVMHINNIRDDNRAENLMWWTQKMNIQQAYDEWRKKAGFTNESRLVNWIKRMKRIEMLDKKLLKIKEYESLTIASRENNIYLSHISACCNWKRKTAWGFIWRFV